MDIKNKKNKYIQDYKVSYTKYILKNANAEQVMKMDKFILSSIASTIAIDKSLNFQVIQVSDDLRHSENFCPILHLDNWKCYFKDNLNKYKYSYQFAEEDFLMTYNASLTTFENTFDNNQSAEVDFIF